MKPSRDKGLESRLTDEDRALCVAYIDGLLAQEAQLEFERRLAQDPELAARVRGLLETDELLRDAQRALGVEQQAARRRKPLVWIASLAAAAALLVWMGSQLLRRAPAAAFDVALAPSSESAREFAATLPQLDGLVARGLESQRGGAELANVPPTKFVELAREAEAALVRQALEADGAAPLTAPFFVVPLRLARPSEVVVFALAPGRAVERLWPAPGGPSVAALPVGQHVLPAERFVLAGAGASERVSYQRGFLTPLGVGELTVLVGVRPAPGAQALELPATLDRSGLESALNAAGFATTALVVREP